MHKVRDHWPNLISDLTIFFCAGDMIFFSWKKRIASISYWHLFFIFLLTMITYHSDYFVENHLYFLNLIKINFVLFDNIHCILCLWIYKYITNLVCYTYFHWFFNPECQHIFGKQTGYIFQSPKTIKTWTTKHYASLNQWYNTE